MDRVFGFVFAFAGRYADPASLAFWMANASELLHFLKSDRHICAFSLDGQDLLADAVQSAFRNASVGLTGELLQSLPPMLSEREDPADDQVATAQVPSFSFWRRSFPASDVLLCYSLSLEPDR